MITVSLETAKRLKEAGWKKECEFVYGYPINKLEKKRRLFHVPSSPRNQVVHACIEAPTLQEILEKLPKGEWELGQITDDDGSIHLRSPRPSVVTKEDLEKLFNEGADEFIGEYITQPVMTKSQFIEVVSKLLNL
jgi:hypothetical protein